MRYQTLVNRLPAMTGLELVDMVGVYVCVSTKRLVEVIPKFDMFGDYVYRASVFELDVTSDGLSFKSDVRRIGEFESYDAEGLKRIRSLYGIDWVRVSDFHDAVKLLRESKSRIGSGCHA